MNPFRYGCIVAGENYCPRRELQRQLKELIVSGQNVVVQGPRRMGKTSLVGETVRSIRGMRMVYVDLFCARTAAEFCRRVECMRFLIHLRARFSKAPYRFLSIR